VLVLFVRYYLDMPVLVLLLDVKLTRLLDPPAAASLGLFRNSTSRWLAKDRNDRSLLRWE
jgi:hypothetical protein